MAGIVLLLVGLALLSVPALLAPATLGVRGEPARFLAGLVTAVAVIVLATELLSLVSAWRPGWMLLFEAAAATAAAAAWVGAGKPSPRIRPPRRAELEAAVRAHPVAAAAVAIALAALAVQGVMALAVAPNNSDSLSYHLARIAFWLQFDSALHFDQGSIRELSQPPNGEFVQGWAFMLGDWERFAALVQWVAAIGLGIAVTLGARVLGFARPAAAFAGALFVLLPQPLLQATTTQNDLIVGCLLAAALVLGVRGLRDRHLGELAVGGVALALAIGTKGTALIAGPSVALIVVAALIGYRPPRGLVLRGAAIAAAAFVLLGAFNYALNVDTYSDPLGPIRDATKRESPLPENAVRVAWSFVDSPGVEVPWLSNVFERAGDALFSGVKTDRFQTFAIDTNVQEDLSSYGLFGLFVFLPLLIGTLVWRRAPPAWRIVAAAALLYIVVFAVASEENPWIGRVLMPAVVLGAPLMAVLHRRRVIAALALALVAVAVVPVLVLNQSKALFVAPGQASIFSLDHLQQQTLNRGPTMRAPLLELQARIDDDTPIGLVHGGNTWDYSFFGPNITRRVMLLTPAQATPETARREGLGAIVFANIEPPPGLPVERIGEDYWLVRLDP